MSECDERRVQGIKRVPVATLVEICGNQPGVPAFEGRSLDVSGRGMHVKTTYVPKVGDPLICRFENQGREIVVEGVVAWRREGDTGGDFGIEFTALDSQSVDALRALCGVAPPEPREEPPVAEEVEHEAVPEGPAPCASGAKVRLHIDGLGSPMKANVRDASRRRVKVGSQLQFLQVGRHLEIEDVTLGARLSARIDAVDVRVDPRTQVPELVVALRYDHVEDATPEPSVVDQAPEVSPYPDDSDPAALEDAVVGSDDPEEAAAREAEAEMLAEQRAADQARLAVDRLGTAAQGAAQAAKATSKVLARFGHSAASRAGTLFKGAGKQLLDLKKQRPAAAKRQTALPPGGPRTFQKLRPQGAPRPAASAAPSQAPRSAATAAGAAANTETAHPRRRGSRIAFIAGGLAVIGATAAYALRDVDGPSETALVPPLAAVAPMNSADAKPRAAPAKPAAPKAVAKAPDDAGGIVANVPLFGPTPMATMEPAPLEPELAPADEEAAEKAAAAATVEDAAWPDEAPAAAPTANPAEVKPWGRGRMHLPTIHKLRLDSAGASISGSISDSGFTVVVPGRKVMESGRAIQRRDERIAQVKTSNTAAGAQVTFQFRGKVPAYRVRLRNDFAEFLISAPEE